MAPRFSSTDDLSYSDLCYSENDKWEYLKTMAEKVGHVALHNTSNISLTTVPKYFSY